MSNLNTNLSQVSLDDQIALAQDKGYHVVAFNIYEADYDRYAKKGKTFITSNLGRISVCDRSQYGRKQAVTFFGQLANFHLFHNGEWVAPSAVNSVDDGGVQVNVLADNEPPLGIIALLTGMVKMTYLDAADAARAVGREDEAREMERKSRSFNHSEFIGDGGHVEFDLPITEGDVTKLYNKLQKGGPSSMVLSISIEMDGLDVRIRANKVLSFSEEVMPLRRPNGRLQVTSQLANRAFEVIEKERAAVDEKEEVFLRYQTRTAKFESKSKTQIRNEQKRKAYRNKQANKDHGRPTAISYTIEATSKPYGSALDALHAELQAQEQGEDTTSAGGAGGW